HFYPKINSKKVQVIHHGFDGDLFSTKISDQKKLAFLANYGLGNSQFLLYVGAIQPRKNLNTLVEAFVSLKKSGKYPELKLVLAGAPAWKAEETFAVIENSAYSKDIILTGGVSFSDLVKFYQYAETFIFPSLYEGFGIPILEAFACGTPVICANNSSLPEVAGEAALYFESGNSMELSEKIVRILGNEKEKEQLIERGFIQLGKFSWEKCARETLNFIKS
ncbi:MAG: glycosyltransferase family 1 protein, partial [Candidatus Moraniibacteriota bacterium]